jgi:hypothetical protein
MKQELLFEQWMIEVISIGISKGLFHHSTTSLNVDTDAFKETYYNDGYEPEDAVNEEISASN